VTREHFDAIVLDVMMPGLNGVETIDEVRKVEPQARFVVITAYSDSELVEEVRKRGVSDILFKPFDAADLLARLEAMRGQLAGS
jgi:YesN/AraC family two-component response regulator